MEDRKKIIADNITALRQARGMTQLELAEKLNYSDKAVSKWERGESLPDVLVLLEMAELFGVTMNDLVGMESKAVPESVDPKAPASRKAPILGMSILLVWLIATIAFSVLFVTSAAATPWLAFIYALPVSAIVWLVLNSVWFDRRRNYLIVSLLLWSTLTAIFLTLVTCGFLFWLLFVLGILGQAIIWLWSRIRKK